MRIVAGQFKGRIIESPKKFATHPMSEKIRGALFNALGDIEGLTVFDAYGGSGAVGLEALSRGAKSVITCDIDRQAAETIQRNIAALRVERQATAVQANCISYLQNNPQTFDIVIADPPYNDVKNSQLITLSQHVASGGLFIVSAPPDVELPDFAELSLALSKTYGDAHLYFYKKSHNVQ